MKTRRILQLLVLAMLISITSALADTLLCWDTDPFVDTFRVLVQSTPDDDQLFALPAVHWQGLNVYQLSGSTSTRLFEATPTVAGFSLTMDNPSSFFGNNPNCRLRVTLQRATLNGSWSFSCTGSPTAYVVNGTMTLAACEPDPSAIAQAMVAPRLAGAQP